MIERKNDQQTFAEMKNKCELFNKKIQLLSQENEKLKHEFENLKENEKKFDLKGMMLQIYNYCLILDHPNKEKV